MAALSALAAAAIVILTSSAAVFLIAFDSSDADGGTPSPVPQEAVQAPTRTPAAERQGATRADPVAFGVQAVTPNWRMRVTGFLRGEAALEVIEVGPDEFATALADPELVAVEIEITASPESTGTRDINRQSFSLTGDNRVRYDALDLRGQLKLLDAALASGDAASGYIAFVVPRGEGNLLLHFTPLSPPLETDRVYLAVEPGAHIDGPGERLPAIDSQAGRTPEQPADPGVWVASGNLAARIVTVLRGPDAESFMVNELGAGELEVPAGMEFVMLHIDAANMGDEPDFLRVSPRAFDVTGSPSATVDQQFTGPLLLDARLYPGGRATGWLTLLVPPGESPLLILRAGPDVESRYLAFE